MTTESTLAKLRPASEVMRLKRLGSSFPTRLSFMRILLRQLNAEAAVVTRTVWQIDDEGYGRAVYSVGLGRHTYSLVAFSTKLSPENRTDRVIAEAWDATFVLFDGVPDSSDLDRLAANAPLQEAGRFTSREIVLCRANKSVRMFEHVVECLAEGKQPDRDMVQSVGYLMRTTAVYGNGKFGIADRALIANRSGLSGPFAAEMLAVWLVRGFTHDLVEHVAQNRGRGKFTPLAASLKRHFGIGNATGLGMAPYLVSHPALFNNWIHARETALARVRSVSVVSEEVRPQILGLLERVSKHLVQWKVEDALQMERILILREEWQGLCVVANSKWLAEPAIWDRLLAYSQDLSQEFQELIVALVLELNGDLVDDLADTMAAQSRGRFDPGMTVQELSGLILQDFTWALEIDFKSRKQQQQFWYVSEDKQEPRLGDRFAEDGAELESPLDIARRIQDLAADLNESDEALSLAEFLMEFPEHRYVVRRVQLAQSRPYSELRDNLIADDCLPIDMLRCKLAFFGASKFDPKSDRWTRINMYQGAPLFADIARADADDWWLPVLEDTQ